MSLTWEDFDPRLDEWKHKLGLAWLGKTREDERKYEGRRFSSRWWPWQRFE